MSDNMKLWGSVENTDKNYTKQVTIRGGFTCVNPEYNIKRATEQFGPFGSTWGVRDEKYTQISDTTYLYTAILFYPDGLIPLHNDISIKEDDWAMKAATGALKKGLAKLGFSADIWLDDFSDDKHVAADRRKTTKEKKSAWNVTNKHTQVHNCIKALAQASNKTYETIFALVTKGIEAGNRYKVLDITKQDDLTDILSRLEIQAEDYGCDLAKIMAPITDD